MAYVKDLPMFGAYRLELTEGLSVKVHGPLFEPNQAADVYRMVLVYKDQTALYYRFPVTQQEQKVQSSVELLEIIKIRINQGTNELLDEFLHRLQENEI